LRFRLCAEEILRQPSWGGV